LTEPEREMWTMYEIARYLGITYWAASKRVTRSGGLSAISREPGLHGRNLYDAETVRQLWPRTVDE
jgi:hypothetical protein